MDHKRIFILGAGASIDHSRNILPNIEYFFYRNPILKQHNGQYDSIHDYIKNTFYIDIYLERPTPKINIETVFTQLELDIENTQETKFFVARYNLLEFIQNTLTNLESTVPEIENSSYHILKNKLNKNDTIITFNWDTMLDNVLGRREILEYFSEQSSNTANYEKYQDNQYCNFASNLSGIRGPTWRRIGEGKPLIKWTGDEGYYFKMHGSVDWKYCENDMCKSHNNGYPILEANAKHICSECYEEMKPLLIPPVLNKQFRKYSLIRKIWNAAAREMEIADEIVIWGYSLPPTDFYSEWLLRRAKKPLGKLVLINPAIISGNPEKKRFNTTFINHFSRQFNLEPHSSNVEHYEYFSDYEQNMRVEQKYQVLLSKIRRRPSSR